MRSDNPLLEAIKEYVEQCQAQDAAELREATLLTWLRTRDFIDRDIAQESVLYRLHFLMRNALYRLAGEQRHVVWQFSPIGVSWAPRQPDDVWGGTALSTNASVQLQDYYLDMAHLDLDAQAVGALLDSFWARYQRYRAAGCQDHQQALSIMSINANFTSVELTQQYRRQVMLMHPDRGGSDQQMQALNSAYALLRATCNDP